MIQMQSLLVVADNTGAKQLFCIKVPGGSKRRTANIGDVVICSVRSASPKANVKKKAVVKAVIVRSRSGIARKDGSRVRFDDNAVVIINDNGEPRGTRVFGPIARECRERGYQKIISLAPDVV